MFCCGRVRCLVENANIAKIVSVNSILPFFNLDKPSVQHFSPYATCFVTMWKMMPQEIECSHGESSQNRMSCCLCQLLVSVNLVAYRDLVMLGDDCLTVCPPTKLWYWAVRNQYRTWPRNYWGRQYDCTFYTYVLRMNTNTHGQSKPSSDFAPRHRLPKESLMKALRAYRT